ncbi:NAD(P)/FAD-dependent oxidoreductase [Kitasatospora sp. NPDC093679]|uniref:NAD(P)/FAD-dependent oxidoreductase n=1 Tax=Kitasatospora sp. NPDC093679 TaxID=3154983 RepID=UPI0034133556
MNRPLPPGARDRRAVLWPAHPGAPCAASPAPRAAVVGGGIAGLSAATALAERGIGVDLYERHPHLGGRLAGWPTRLADGTGVTMNRGFHAFFRQYYNLRALLRRIDPSLGFLKALPDYPLRHRTGGTDGFAGLPRTPPWNALAFALRSPTFGLRDMARIDARAARQLAGVTVATVYDALDHISADDFLAAVNFPPRARHLAFDVFSRSFFSSPDALSAAELVLMFHIYFLGSAEGLLFDVAGEPFPVSLWDPLAARLAGSGVRIHTGAAVEGVLPRPDGRFEVSAAGGTVRCDAVVLATDPGALSALVADSPGLGSTAWRSTVTGVRTAPPFLVSRHWTDTAARPDRAGFLGTAGYGPLDNVSVVERWEGEAARWAAKSGGSVIELHAYAVPHTADRTRTERELVARLRRLYPELATAGIVDSRHVWRSDCPRFAVGGYRQRPDIGTPYERLVVAGDGVRCPLPTALMERAATTGFLAANRLLRSFGLLGHDLWSVPVRGRNPLLRALSRA